MLKIKFANFSILIYLFKKHTYNHFSPNFHWNNHEKSNPQFEHVFEVGLLQ